MSEDKKKTESPQKDPWAVGVYNKYVNPNTGVPKQQTPPPPPRGMEAGRVGVQAPTQPKVTAPSKNDSSNTISPHSGMESARVGCAPPQATTPQKEAVPQSRGMEASRVGDTVNYTPIQSPPQRKANTVSPPPQRGMEAGRLGGNVTPPKVPSKDEKSLEKYDRGYQLPDKDYIVAKVRDEHDRQTEYDKAYTDYKRDKDSRYKPKPGVDYMPDEEFSAFTAYLRDNNIGTGPKFSAEDAMYHPELAKYRRENIEKLHADPDFAEFQKYYQSHGYNDDYFRGIPYKSSPVYLGFIGSKTQREMMNEYRAKQAKNGKGVSDARMAGSNDATSNYDRGAGKEEKGNISGADNTSGVTAEVPSTHFEDMYRKTTEAPMSSEETTKMRKRHNRQRTLAAIIDGISALANVYFASRGAGANGSTNFSGTLGNKWREYWDKVRTDRDAYNKGLLQARQMDYNAKLRRLERAEDKAEREAREANAEKWRQKTWDRDEQRHQVGIAYRDARNEKMDKRYENEQKEGTRRYNQNLGFQYQQHNDNKNLRQAQIDATKARGLRGKQIVFVNGEGKQVSIYENVWRGSMQQVFDTLVKELTPTDEKEKREFEFYIEELDTPQKKEDFVKQNWHKSPGASQIMLALSGIDPATMASSIGEEGGGLGWGKKTDNKETDW